MTPTPAFVPPGPGSWRLDDEHFSRPVSPVVAEVFEEGFTEGMRLTMARHGMLLDTIASKVVHGFPYTQVRPIGTPPGAPTPPRWVLRVLLPVLLRVHPELRARRAVAETLFERRPWREALRHWDEVLRDQTVAAHAALAAVAVDALDDAGLAEHLLSVRAHAARMITQDHSLNLTVFLPLGDFLAHAREWTGLPEATLLTAIRGCSAVSAGDTRERARLVAALRADVGARALLEGEAPAADRFEALSRWPGEVGAAMAPWRVITGNALVMGIDVDLPVADEDPAQLLEILRVVVDASPPPPADEAALEAVRARVPAAHRDRFEAMLDDARAAYRLRDERHLYGALPVIGITRKALLAVGRRLASAGRLPREEDVFTCTGAELDGMLRGASGPTDWEARRAARSRGIADAPAQLGPPEAPPPDLAWLPAEMARAMRALDVYMSAMAEAPPPPAPPPAPEATPALAGLGVSAGVCEGFARVCGTVHDIARLQPGDVLVAATTTPAINVVLPLLGAIVTDRGGALSHAAIVTREYGIPGVVGTREATRRIADGARVRVDGTTGRVEILA